MRDQERLAGILTAEQIEARGEIAYAAAYIEFCAEQANRINDETIKATSATDGLSSSASFAG